MAETRVSDEFNEFYQNESAAIQVAKESEARMANIPLDVGDEGTCIITDMSFGKTPDSTKDGVHKEGCPFCQIGVRVVDHPTHAGKRAVKTFWFWKNATSTRAEQVKTWLDYLENRMGLPREVRVGHQNVKEIGDWYQNNTVSLNFKVTAPKEVNDYNEGKEINFYIPKDIITADESVVPPPQGTTAAPKTTSESAPTSPPDSDWQVGEIVEHMEEKWEVLTVYQEKLEIRNVSSGKQKVAVKTSVSKL